MHLPLFALNTVLFPGGLLPLRVFEPRYMDMVRGCMKDDAPFGIVLIRAGREVGGPAQVESVGTLARISAWDMPQLGMLHLRTLGGQRFRVLHSEIQADGLRTAEADLIDADEDFPIAAAHQPCADLLRRILADLESNRGKPADAADPLAGMPVQSPYALDSSVWVGNRLAELIPTNLSARQKLMELPDAKARLDVIDQFLRQHAVLG